MSNLGVDNDINELISHMSIQERDKELLDMDLEECVDDDDDDGDDDDDDEEEKLQSESDDEDHCASCEYPDTIFDINDSKWHCLLCYEKIPEKKQKKYDVTFINIKVNCFLHHLRNKGLISIQDKDFYFYDTRCYYPGDMISIELGKECSTNKRFDNEYIINLCMTKFSKH